MKKKEENIDNIDIESINTNSENNDKDNESFLSNGIDISENYSSNNIIIEDDNNIEKLFNDLTLFDKDKNNENSSNENDDINHLPLLEKIEKKHK